MLPQEELTNAEEQLRIALEDKGNALLNERAKEVRRLEALVAGILHVYMCWRMLTYAARKGSTLPRGARRRYTICIYGLACADVC